MAYRLLTSPVGWLILAATVIFLVLRLTVDGVALSVFLNCAVVFVTAGVALGLLPEVWSEMTERRLTTLSLWSSGTAAFCLTAFANSAWNGLYVASHNGWWARVPDNDLRLFGVLVGGLMLLTAPGVLNGRVAARKLMHVGLALGGAVATGILLWWLA